MLIITLLISILGITCESKTYDNRQKISLAYVDASRNDTIDPNLFTHLIYSFAYFNDNNDGLEIPYQDCFAKMLKLKEGNPSIKIILGIGGPKREGFSEMCRDKNKRRKFVRNCKQIIKKYHLDGVDLDWEFPGTEAGGHTACQQDAENYGYLVRDLRKALGKSKWISFYSNNSGNWIDFERMLPYVDYVNVSGYNLSGPKERKPLNHQSSLYPSKKYGDWCVSKSIKLHIKKGVPPEKILLGIPFFGRGKKPFNGYLGTDRIDDFSRKNSSQVELCWDDEAKVPYYRDKEGNLVLGFDDERSIEYKCDFIREQGLAGAFVWHYDSDYKDHRLAKKLREGMKAQDSIPQ